jgi:glucosamine-phosphate N-acetyltransferase
MEPTDYVKGHLVVLAQLSPFSTEEVTQEAYTEFATGPGRNVWVMEDAGRIIASGTLLVEPKLIHCLSAVGHIEDVVVAADVRGCGIGRTLIAHLIALAKQQGCYKVILDCNEQKAPFYEACGFSRKGSAMAIYF